MVIGAKSRLKPTRALRLARAFARDRKGGVAVLFGIALPLVTLLAFFAVDYSRASLAKQVLQEALDAASLIAARSTAVTADQIDAVGDAAFAAQLPDSIGGFTPDGQGRISNVTFSLNGSTVVGQANGYVQPFLFGVITGESQMAVHAQTDVVRSLNKLEIALVLDTTGSMQGTKIANLITAAKNFITTMEGAAARSTEPNSVRISIVPFSTTVKVNNALSMSSYNTSTYSMSGLPTWLDGRARALDWDNDIFTNASSSAARQDRFAKLKAISQPWGGCVEARVAPYDIRDDAPTSSNVSTLFIPFFWPDEPSSPSGDYGNTYLSDGTSSSNWKTRQGNPSKYSGSISSGSFSSYDKGPNAGCDMQGVMRLSTNFTALRNQVNGLVANGETNIPLGLMWGWHTLSPNAPFADGVSYTTPHVTKIIVLMTDGDNTMGSGSGDDNKNKSNYHGYGYIWQDRLGTTSNNSNTRTTKMNQRMVNGSNEALCSNIKNKGIRIYSVGVGVSSSNKTLLQQCATSTDFYYDVDSQAGNLNAAFDAIAGSIQNLRIAR